MPRSQVVYINLPLGSIIYAPLYVAAFRSTPDFNFRFSSQPDPIFPAQHQWRRAFAPIIIDPVFSPVIQRQHFKRNDKSWFAVGDPLRVRRLVEHHGLDQCAFTFLGTLVTRLAFWTLTERRGPYRASEDRVYNYIACHTPGMTGYHLAEHLFRVNAAYNPLAPTTPGQEVEHFFRMLGADWQRTSPGTDRYFDDPVTFAVLTTEIGNVLYHLNRFSNSGKVFFDVELVGKRFFPSKLPSDDFIMTAIVARRYDDNPDRAALVKAAGEVLREKLLDALQLLRSDPQAFAGKLSEFYSNYSGSFASPTDPDDADAYLLDTVTRIANIYSGGNDLVPSGDARAHTDRLLSLSLRSEYRARHKQWPSHATLKREYDLLCTKTWDPNGILWP
jgi:hypothetical protein